MANPTNWKNRYNELAEKQEKQQVLYRKKVSLLVAALDSVVKLGRNIDAGADEKLLALRGLLRQENFKNADLEQVVDAVARQATRSLEIRDRAIDQVRTDMTRLVKQTRSITRDPNIVLELKQREKQISQDRLYVELTRLLGELVKLQAISISTSGRQQSLLGRLFSGKSDPESEGSPEDDEINPQEDVTGDGQTGESHVLSSTLNHTLGYLTDPLNKLLHQLTPPPEVAGTFDVATRLLEEDLDLEVIPDLVRSVSQVAVASMKHERQENEHFLSQLNERLEDATTGLATSRQMLSEEMDAGIQLNASIRQTVSEIQACVAGSQDIEDLKQRITANLNRVVSIVDQHETEGRARHESFSDQLECLAERARQMESAATEAESRIEFQTRRALTDVLTALPNREAYEERVEQEINRWQREDTSLSLALVNLDLFKSLNDSYGHQAGDEVLRQVAKELRSRLRTGDFLGRFVADTFVLLLPSTPAEQAYDLVESLRLAVADLQLPWQQTNLQITVSAGVVNFRGKDIEQSAFTRADRALFQAKNSGRNRTCIAAE